MTNKKTSDRSALPTEVDDDAELAAMAKVVAALKELTKEARQRVIEYAVRRYDLSEEAPQRRQDASLPATQPRSTDAEPNAERTEESPEGLEGVSPIAQRWMQRNGLSADAMSRIFSLGADEIDLVAKSVPGNSVRSRLRSVVLLEGIAGFLSTGAPRREWRKIKQSAVHYNADAASNTTAYMKSLASEATGSAASGYTLTARGLASANNLINEMVTKAK